MLRRPKHSKIEVVAPKEEEEDIKYLYPSDCHNGVNGVEAD